jgi:hypothetical protein
MNATKNGMLKAAEQHDDEDSLVPPVQADRPSRRPTPIASVALQQSLADIKGQAQFLLYLADQIEDSLEQLDSEADACHSAFLCKVLGMYSGQLESKHQGLGEKIAEACQEVYVTVREREMI